MKQKKGTTNIKYLISINYYSDYSYNKVGSIIYKRKLYYIYKVTKNFHNFLKENGETFYRTLNGVFVFIENLKRY